MDAVKVPLTKPIQAHGETLKELTLNEPTLEVLEDVEIAIGGGADGRGEVKLKLGTITKVVAGMAGIPPSSAKQISAADLPALGKAVMGFMPAFLATGGN